MPQECPFFQKSPHSSGRFFSNYLSTYQGCHLIEFVAPRAYFGGFPRFGLYFDKIINASPNPLTFWISAKAIKK